MRYGKWKRKKNGAKKVQKIPDTNGLRHPLAALSRAPSEPPISHTLNVRDKSSRSNPASQKFEPTASSRSIVFIY